MGFDAYLITEGEENDIEPPTDSRLFSSLIFDIDYQEECTMEMLSNLYNLDLSPLRQVGSDSSDQAWQDPGSLSQAFESLLEAIEREGDDFIGMPLNEHLLYPGDVTSIKKSLREVIEGCNKALKSGKRVQLVIN